MNRKGTVTMAEPIAQLQRQLEEHRRMRPRRAKLPESIWDAAAELAREHGVYAVAHPLRLDYVGLKKRLGEVAAGRPDKSKPVFVELIAPPPAGEEWLIEFESTRGDKMRIHWPVRTAPDWTALLRAWRDAEV
jgi:hypothetical protein